MKNKLNYKKILNYFTLIFLFFAPLCDTIYFFSKITTLARIICILIILTLTIFCYKDSRKYLKWLILYYLLCMVYFAVDVYHAQGFFSLIPNNFNYHWFTEFLTIIKLMMPITLIYCLMFQKLDIKKYFFVVKVWIILIAGSIIILNIFKLSLSSYSTEIIKYNIFEWQQGLYYAFTSSRGLFVYANQETIIMLMLLIMETYEVLYYKKRNIIYIILLTLASLMLGTRVSSLGGLAVLIGILVLYVINSIIKKERISLNILLFIIPIFIWIPLLLISPYKNRNVELEKVNTIGDISYDNITKTDNTKTTDSKINEQKIYVDLYHDEDKMPNIFYTKYYSYDYDIDFWYAFVKNTPNELINYRYIETSIIKRVVEIDNRISNVLFGISNTRIQNIVNIERDFICQYYAFGIIGELILFLVYPLMLIYSIINYLKNKTYFNILIICVIMLYIFVSFLTGNILNSITPMIYFSFLCSKRES